MAKNKKYYYLFFTVKMMASPLSNQRGVQEMESFAVMDESPILWLLDQLKSGNSIALRFYKEISKVEFDLFVAMQQEKQKEQQKEQQQGNLALADRN
jgi:hypothetical protein